jgi:D-amino peptidase
MRNLLAEELHPAAELLSGGPKTWSMMEGVERGHDAVFCIGYHAKAGTQNAILDHTYTDRILDVRLNGDSVGELGINAALAGTYGTPVALVSGDQALAVEATALLGHGVQTVTVKTAVSRHAARSVSPSESCRMIEEAAQTVLAAMKAGKRPAKPLVVSNPVRLEVDFHSTVEADLASMAPGITRKAPRTVGFQHGEYREVFRAFRTMFNLAAGE